MTEGGSLETESAKITSGEIQKTLYPDAYKGRFTISRWRRMGEVFKG